MAAGESPVQEVAEENAIRASHQGERKNSQPCCGIRPFQLPLIHSGQKHFSDAMHYGSQKVTQF